MGVYWSVELCGWVPSPGPPDPLATPWSLRVPEPRRVDVQPVTPHVPEQAAATRPLQSASGA